MPANTVKPVIGLSTYAEPARWAAWHAPAALLPPTYAEQLAAAVGPVFQHYLTGPIATVPSRPARTPGGGPRAV